MRVASEIGRLRRVLVHRPGPEIDRMIPSMMETLLFDDILYGGKARQEHETFTRILNRLGVQTLDPADLLAETLEDGEVRSEILEELNVADSTRRILEELDPKGLADALIAGLILEDHVPTTPLEDLFRVPPIPNYFFQRDPQIVLGDEVLISSMKASARRRETLLARTIFRHHPALSGYARLEEVWNRPAPGLPRGATATLEGGDLLVLDENIVMVGISERTNRRGIEVLARFLRGGGKGPRHLIVVELPHRRSYMHLDTVFTLIDRDACLAFLPVIESDSPEAAHVYTVDLARNDLSFTLAAGLPQALEALGHPVRVIPCGGRRSLIDQQREQWTDGANALAVAPGLILLYVRNQQTLAELERQGWRIIDDRRLLTSDVDPFDGPPTVITFVGDELSRARGGPRCMSHPLERDPV